MNVSNIEKLLKVCAFLKREKKKLYSEGESQTCVCSRPCTRFYFGSFKTRSNYRSILGSLKPA